MSFPAGVLKLPKTQGVGHYKQTWVRVIAVLCVASTLDVKAWEVDPHKAAVRFRAAMGGAAASNVAEDHAVFCMRHFNNLWDRGTVADKPRSGRPSLIEAKDARAAGELLMAGYWKTVKVKGGKGRTEERLFNYTTVAEAVSKNEQLRHIFERYECSDRLMLDNIHRLCPDLRRVRLVSHHEFTAAEMEARMEFGAYMLNMINQNPSSLYDIVFCDESTFMLHGRTQHSVQVYCSSTATRASDVCHFSDLADKPLKVHFFVAVTANEHFQPSGLVLYEECTGTDGINRIENKHLDGSTWVGDWGYQVSSCGLGFKNNRSGCYHEHLAECSTGAASAAQHPHT